MYRFIFQYGIITIFLVTGFVSCSSSFSRMEPIAAYEQLVLYGISEDEYPVEDEEKAELPEILPLPEFTEEELIALLGNIEYEEDTIWGRHQRYIFYEEELRYIAREIVRNVKWLKEDERLVVVSRFDPDRSVLSRMERVSFLFWNDKNGLNIVFGDIRYEIPYNDPLQFDEWYIIPPIDLSYGYPELAIVETDNYTLKEVRNHIHRTWVTVPVNRVGTMKMARRSEESDDNEKSASSQKEEGIENATLSQKLSQLNEAKEKGLISPEEYESIRSRMIQQFVETGHVEDSGIKTNKAGSKEQKTLKPASEKKNTDNGATEDEPSPDSPQEPNSPDSES